MSKKKNQPMDRKTEMEAARLFGKHVSRQKAILMAVVTTIACASPMALGVRLWSAIPEIVTTGLTLPSGEDDSLPRFMAVYGLPGLMCTLNLICHGQLLYNQNQMTVPRTPVRLLGRWGFPVLSVILCSGMILRAAEQPLDLPFLTPCALGMALLILGGHVWDCPRSAKLALRFSFTSTDEAWQTVHRFAGWVWMAAGVIVLAAAMTGAVSGLVVAAVVLLAAAAPFVYGALRASMVRR